MKSKKLRLSGVSTSVIALHLLSHESSAMDPINEQKMIITPCTNTQKFCENPLLTLMLEGVTSDNIRKDITEISKTLTKKYDKSYLELLAPLIAGIPQMLKGIPGINLNKEIKYWQFNKGLDAIMFALMEVEELHKTELVSLIAPMINGLSCSERCKLIKAFNKIQHLEGFKSIQQPDKKSYALFFEAIFKLCPPIEFGNNNIDNFVSMIKDYLCIKNNMFDENDFIGYLLKDSQCYNALILGWNLALEGGDKIIIKNTNDLILRHFLKNNIPITDRIVIKSIVATVPEIDRNILSSQIELFGYLMTDPTCRMGLIQQWREILDDKNKIKAREKAKWIIDNFRKLTLTEQDSIFQKALSTFVDQLSENLQEWQQKHFKNYIEKYLNSVNLLEIIDLIPQLKNQIPQEYPDVTYPYIIAGIINKEIGRCKYLLISESELSGYLMTDPICKEALIQQWREVLDGKDKRKSQEKAKWIMNNFKKLALTESDDIYQKTLRTRVDQLAENLQAWQQKHFKNYIEKHTKSVNLLEIIDLIPQLKNLIPLGYPDATYPYIIAGFINKEIGHCNYMQILELDLSSYLMTDPICKVALIQQWCDILDGKDKFKSQEKAKWILNNFKKLALTESDDIYQKTLRTRVDQLTENLQGWQQKHFKSYIEKHTKSLNLLEMIDLIPQLKNQIPLGYPDVTYPYMIEGIINKEIGHCNYMQISELDLSSYLMTDPICKVALIQQWCDVLDGKDKIKSQEKAKWILNNFKKLALTESDDIFQKVLRIRIDQLGENHQGWQQKHFKNYIEKYSKSLNLLEMIDLIPQLVPQLIRELPHGFPDAIYPYLIAGIINGELKLKGDYYVDKKSIFYYLMINKDCKDCKEVIKYLKNIIDEESINKITSISDLILNHFTNFNLKESDPVFLKAIETKLGYYSFKLIPVHLKKAICPYIAQGFLNNNFTPKEINEAEGSLLSYLLRSPMLKQGFEKYWRETINAQDKNNAIRMINLLINNFQTIGLIEDEEGGIIQEAIRIGIVITNSLNAPNDYKNPYVFHEKLMTERAKPLDLNTIKLAPYIFENRAFTLNPLILKELPQNQLFAKDLPKYNCETLNNLKGQIEQRLQDPFNKLTLTTQEFNNILAGSMGGNYLNNLLLFCENAENRVDLIAAKFIALVAHLEELDNTYSDGCFSKRETEFLRMLYSIQHCASSGKPAGIQECYETLPREKKYEVQTLSKGEAFLVEVIRSKIEEVLNGQEKFYLELTRNSRCIDINQGVHQEQYVRNLIGLEIGCPTLRFEVYSHTLHLFLISRTKEEIVQIYYKHFLPESLIKSVLDAVNQELGKKTCTLYMDLRKIFGAESWFKNAWTYDTDTYMMTLNEDGAIQILLKLGYLKTV